MDARRRPHLAAAVTFGAAVALVSFSAAFACNPASRLEVAPAEAVPGASVTGTGTGFVSGGSEAPDVVVRFGGPVGTVIWSGRPDATGTFTFAFTVPSVAPGQYQVVTTTFGYPAAAVLHVLAPPATTTTTTTRPPVTTTLPSPATTVPSGPDPAPTATTAVPVAPAGGGTSATGRATSTTAARAPAAAGAAPPAAASTLPLAVAAPTTTQAPTAAPTTATAPPGPAAGITLATREAVASGGGVSAAPVVLGLVGVGTVLASAVGYRRFRRRPEA